MNIRCPHCQTVFRVNPERIPATGVRAKCARCGDTFMVSPPAPGSSQAAATAGPAPAPARPAAPPTPAPAASSAGSVASARTGPAAPRTAEPLASKPPAPHTSSVAPSASAAGGAAENAAAAFGARDPKARAERLARALVSDIVAYHPERRERSLESGSLRTEFRDEIMKSWEEYVAQVGIDVAKSTPYFREALNSILAKGQKVF